MADHEELSEPPDLSDLNMVIMNAETAEGRQLSFVVGLTSESDKLEMTTGESIGSDERGDFTHWQFHIYKRER